ncbi:MAG TPA: RDD family protein [Thermoanaerobaculia bacterium]
MKKKIRTYHPHEGERMEALAGLPLASFGRRLAAFVLDFGLTAVVFTLGAIFVVAPIGNRTGLLRHNLLLKFDFHHWYSLVFLVLYFGLTTYWGNGQTPGKWLCKIRVVSLVEERITLWTAIERALGYGASALEAGFGFLQYFVHPNCRTVHDRIAETIVVDERKARAAAAGRPLDPEPLSSR